jgi:hypothetical protein
VVQSSKNRHRIIVLLPCNFIPRHALLPTHTNHPVD